MARGRPGRVAHPPAIAGLRRLPPGSDGPLRFRFWCLMSDVKALREIANALKLWPRKNFGTSNPGIRKTFRVERW